MTTTVYGFNDCKHCGEEGGHFVSTEILSLDPKEGTKETISPCHTCGHPGFEDCDKCKNDKKVIGKNCKMCGEFGFGVVRAYNNLRKYNNEMTFSITTPMARLTAFDLMQEIFDDKEGEWDVVQINYYDKDEERFRSIGMYPAREWEKLQKPSGDTLDQLG